MDMEIRGEVSIVANVEIVEPSCDMGLRFLQRHHNHNPAEQSNFRERTTRRYSINTMLLFFSITSPQATRFFPRYFPCRYCRLLLVTLWLGLVLSSRTARANPHVNGTWSAVEPWPIVPIHMILLKTGKVLSYGTNPAGQGGQGFFYDVWDPSIGLANASSHFTLPTQTATNIFCSGQVNLADGEVLILGGSQVVNGVRNSGTAYTQLFNSDTERLYREDRNMFQARWYPSVTVLGNGNVVAQVRSWSGAFLVISNALFAGYRCCC
jgi:hypothetical protein